MDTKIDIMDIDGREDAPEWVDNVEDDDLSLSNVKHQFLRKWSLDATFQEAPSPQPEPRPAPNKFESFTLGKNSVTLPVSLLNPSFPLEELFTLTAYIIDWKVMLSPEEKQSLMKLLPPVASEADLNSLLTSLFTPSQTAQFSGVAPMVRFANLLRSGMLNSEIAQYRKVVDYLKSKRDAIERQKIELDIAKKILADKAALGLSPDSEFEMYLSDKLRQFASDSAAFDRENQDSLERERKKRIREAIEMTDKDEEELLRKGKTYRLTSNKSGVETDSDSEFMIPEDVASVIRARGLDKTKLALPIIPRAPPLIRKRTSRPKPTENTENKEGADNKTDEPKAQDANDPMKVEEREGNNEDRGDEENTKAPGAQKQTKEKSEKTKSVPEKTEGDNKETTTPKVRKKPLARKELKEAIPSVPIPPCFTLFTQIRDILRKNMEAEVQTVAEALNNNEPLKRNIPNDYPLIKFVEVALQFLSAPRQIFALKETVPTCVSFDVASKFYKWILPEDSPFQSLLERLETIFFFYIWRTKPDPAKPGETLNVPDEYFKKQANRETVANLSPASIELYHKQEQERFEKSSEAFVFDIDGFQSIVGPIKVPIKAPKKSREHPLLVPDRDFNISLLNMVINGGSRLPGGVGTRQDVAKYVSYSKYVRSDVNMDKWLSIISAGMDRIQLVPDAPIKFDVDLKLWVYNHRLRTPEDFTRINAALEAAGVGNEADDAADA